MVVVVALLAAACGSGKGDDQTGTPSTPQLQTTASTAAAGTAALTPQGTTLSYGQPAFIPIDNKGRSGVISVAVLTVVAGVHQDLATLKFATGDPYYVTMTIQNTGAPPDLGSYEPELLALQDDGIDAAAVDEPDDFPPCMDHGPFKLPLGASFTTCEAYVADSGRTIKALQYYENPDAKPISWH